MIAIAKKILGSNNIKLGYIKLGIFFNNKLPKNCINFFHTDDYSKKVDEKKMFANLQYQSLYQRIK